MKRPPGAVFASDQIGQKKAGKRNVAAGELHERVFITTVLAGMLIGTAKAFIGNAWSWMWHAGPSFVAALSLSEFTGNCHRQIGVSSN
ncbi:hypothetical protein A0H81_11845 [Grifola frondosa]|uniref:Uncharacterized protein n=1 Tax=Grifola frondosa TaxID=5627 RepID=A0A1C7LTU1_GRIFR|nr:hypothetical protein A0H81_11845 [Grifola frondosa]